MSLSARMPREGLDREAGALSPDLERSRGVPAGRSPARPVGVRGALRHRRGKPRRNGGVSRRGGDPRLPAERAGPQCRLPRRDRADDLRRPRRFSSEGNDRPVRNARFPKAVRGGRGPGRCGPLASRREDRGGRPVHQAEEVGRRLAQPLHVARLARGGPAHPRRPPWFSRVQGRCLPENGSLEDRIVDRPGDGRPCLPPWSAPMRIPGDREAEELTARRTSPSPGRPRSSRRTSWRRFAGRTREVPRQCLQSPEVPRTTRSLRNRPRRGPPRWDLAPRGRSFSECS